MCALLSCNDLGKSYLSYPLFRGISLSVAEGERIGMLGPNGAGKSTLLKIFAGIETSDEGTVTRQKGLRMAYLAQEDHFPAGKTVGEVLAAALVSEHLDESEIHGRVGEVRSVLGFSETEQKVDELSGGWKKRLAIGRQIILKPELLLLDEPTNHLDLEGITWLEKFIKGIDCSLIIISHDRTLLERVTSRVVEINRIYPQGFFSIDGNYSRFLEKRAEYLEGLARYEDSLRNKVRREIEWLRRGPKARTTKAKGRIQEAGRKIAELQEYESRSALTNSAGIEFDGSGRQTKRLISVENISKAYGEHLLFKKLEFLLSPGARFGIVGANGSGKSTLLKILNGTLKPDEGEVRFASNLKIVTFEQNRAALDKDVSLKRAISADSDTVVFRDRPLHVAAWAKRFLFLPQQLDVPVRSLSGGEQARLLIAKLMLQPADVLLLDEPTNDLDIDTLQVLEESLDDFAGAVVLITHDRFMLDRVSKVIIGLDGSGDAQFFADYSQWETYFKDSRREQKQQNEAVAEKFEPARISQNEFRELGKLEKQIEKLEARIKKLVEELSAPELASDLAALTKLHDELKKHEADLSAAIERWSVLEEKRTSGA